MVHLSPLVSARVPWGEVITFTLGAGFLGIGVHLWRTPRLPRFGARRPEASEAVMQPMEMFVSRMMAVVSLLVGGMTFWLATVGLPGGWVFWRLVGAGLIAYGGYALLFPTSRLVRHLSHGRSGASSRPASVEVVYTRIYAVMAVVVGGVVLWVMSL